MKTSGRNVLVAVALVLAMTLGCLRAGAQSNPPSEAKRQAKRLLTPQYPELARKLNLSGSYRDRAGPLQGRAAPFRIAPS